MSDDLDNLKDSQKHLNFKKKWFAAHQSVVKSQYLDQTIESIKTLEDNNIFSNEMVIVHAVQDFKPVYVSKNIEKILGYTQEEFLSWKSVFFKIGAYQQPDFFPNLMKWDRQFNKLCPHKNTKAKARSHLCGMRFLCKDGAISRFLIRQESELAENLIMPEFDVLFFLDITHLMKTDDYWMLFETYNEKEVFSQFYSKSGVDNYPITAREKEVLKIIADGKNTKEVARELNISADTVGQHRKNMIRKMMAKDTSALIQL